MGGGSATGGGGVILMSDGGLGGGTATGGGAAMGGGTNALYVDPVAGTDLNPGTAPQPFKTLSHALAQTVPTPRIIYVAGDKALNEGQLIWAGQAQILGGYSGYPSWTHDAGRSIIDGGLTALAINGLDATSVLDSFDVYSANDLTNDSEASVGIKLISASLQLRHVRVFAGRGGNGLDGVSPPMASASSPGMPGNAGVEGGGATVNVTPGAGGNGNCGAGRGGGFGAADIPGYGGSGAAVGMGGGDGGNAAPWDCSTCMCMTFTNGIDGADGFDGPSGTSGNDGSGGALLGTFPSGVWLPADGVGGSAGDAGAPGNGGGGGGGAVVTAGAAGTISVYHLSGGSGGGGGAPGCGGAAGGAGRGGGASVALLLLSASHPDLIDVTASAGLGGHGGDGGFGSPGQQGGNGGKGGAAVYLGNCTMGMPFTMSVVNSMINPQAWSGNGGAGGKGGHGGHGGNGGAGSGGPSLGIWCLDGSSFTGDAGFGAIFAGGPRGIGATIGLSGQPGPAASKLNCP
jgi:hypothetical protein